MTRHRNDATGKILRLLGACSVFAIAANAGPAFAQAASPQVNAAVEDNAATEQDIVVTGIRQSVQASIAVKRQSNAIVDAITAEDIGKLPDQNIAETLQRISGVQVDRGGLGQQQFVGEGSGVTIRGIGQNRIEFNGTNIVGSSTGGGVALQDFNPEILASLTVTKSPSAKDIEGALGGVVNLISRKPLDLDSLFVAGRAEGIYYDQAEKMGYRASGVVSTKFANDTIGILIGASRYQYDRLTEEVDNGGYTTAFDLDGNGLATNNPATPTRYVNNVVAGQVTRTGIDGSIQWRPSPDFELNFDALYSKANLDQAASRYQILLGNSVSNAKIDANNTVVSGTFNNAIVRVTAYDEPIESEQAIFALYGKWTPGRFTVEGRASRSDSSRYTRLFVPLLVPKTGNTASLYYDTTSGSNLPTGALTTNFNTLNPNNYRLDTTVDNSDINENTGDDYRLDIGYDTGWNWIKTLRIGGRFEALSLRTDRYALNTAVLTLRTATPSLDRNGDGQIGYEEFTGLNITTISNYFNGRSGNLPREFLGGSVDPDVYADSVNLPVAPQDASGVRGVDEDTKAIYVQADLDGTLFGIDMRGNVGVRYVDTKRVSTGNAIVGTQVFPQRLKSNFTNWLPSINLTANLQNNLLLRFAAAKVVARPSLSDVAPGTRPNLVNLTATRGNPNLRPFTATQYDVSLEWYFDNASLISISGFYKDVGSFTSNTTVEEFIDLGPLSGIFLITVPQNGENGTIKGFDANFQHVFSGLPEAFEGLGVGATYTFVDSKTPLNDPVTGKSDPLQGLSRHSVNLTAFIEQKWGNVRLTYNWRDKFLELRQPDTVGGNRYQAAYGQFDLSSQINLTEKTRLTFSAVNITKSAEKFFHTYEDRFRAYRVNDRRFYFGIASSF